MLNAVATEDEPSPAQGADISDRVNKLWHRFFLDNGKEQFNAAMLMKSAVLGNHINPGHFHYIGPENDDPMMYLLTKSERRAAGLQRDIKQLEQKIKYLEGKLRENGKRISPDSDFPWAKYPQVEEAAMKMRLSGEVESKVAAYVERATGLPRPNGRLINARFTNAKPPASLVMEPLKGTEDITWQELWVIGTKGHAKAWIPRIFLYAGVYDEVLGERKVLPSNLTKTDPNQLLNPEQRQHLRNRYWGANGANPLPFAKSEAEDFIRETSTKGFPTKRILTFADPRRVTNLKEEGRIFEVDGKYVHTDHAKYFPDCVEADNAKALRAQVERLRNKK